MRGVLKDDMTRQRRLLDGFLMAQGTSSFPLIISSNNKYIVTKQ